MTALRLSEPRAHYYAQIPEPLIGAPRAVVAVYGWLDRRAGRRGWWEATQREIAAGAGVSLSSVQRALARLEALDLVRTADAGPIQGGRLTRFELPERLGSDPQTGHLPTRKRPASGSLQRHQRVTSAIYTSIRSEKPPKSPYMHTQTKKQSYDAVVLRDWPALQRRFDMEVGGD